MATIDGLFSTVLSGRAELMGRMMERLDVDLAAAGSHANGMTLAHAARACLVCGQADKCRAYLCGAPVPGFETPAMFCPNAGTFATLARH